MHSISLKMVEVLLCYIFYSFAASVLISAVFFSVFEVVVVQLPSHVRLFEIPWTAAWQASLSLTISQSCPSSCPLHQWCHPAILSSDALFSHPQSLPASGSFPMSSLFTSIDQNTRDSESVLPVSIQGWFHLGLTGLISSVSKGLSEFFSSTTVWRHQFFGTLLSFWSSSHKGLHGPLSADWYLCFSTHFIGVIALLPGSNCLLISWLQSPFAVILEPKKRKSVIVPLFPLLFAVK